MPRLFGFGGISSRAFFATNATVVSPDLSQAPTKEKPAAEEPSKRRKRIYKRMKPNGSPEMEINNTLKALRQKARLSPRWISHVLLQCGKRSPDVRARTTQAIEIFETFNTLAQEVSEEVPAIVYSALIGALVNNLARRPTEAPDVLKKVELYVQKMRNAKHDMALPTLTSLVRLYGLARRPEKAMEIVQGVEEKAMETDIQWYNTLIEMFYLNGASEKAKEVHDKLLASEGTKANTITYNLMMKIAVQRNDYRDVIELFKSMKERGVTPDDFSYLEAIRAAGRLSDPNAAQAYFDEMRASGVKPAIYVWTALVDAYCRSNAIKKAFELADEMRVAGVPPDTVIWRIIRDAAQRCGKGDMWAKLKPSWVSNLHAASLERQRKPTKGKTGKAPSSGEEAEAGTDADAPRSPRRHGSGPTEWRERGERPGRGGERAERTDRPEREGRPERRGEGRAEGRDRPERGDRPDRGARPGRGGRGGEGDRPDRGRRPERGGGGGERGDSRGRRPSMGREERGRRGGAAGRGREQGDRGRARSRDRAAADE